MWYGPKRLTRSNRHRLWAGVAGGMAEYFDVDPVIMRIIWVAAAILTHGLAIPAYIAMWLIMPRDDQPAGVWPGPAAPPSTAPGDQPTYTGLGDAPPPPPTEPPSGGPTARPGFTPEEEELLRPVAPPPMALAPEETGRRRRAAGVLLIGLGVVFFAQQLGIVVPVRWDLLWPLAIVAVGVFILMKHSGGSRRYY